MFRHCAQHLPPMIYFQSHTRLVRSIPTLQMRKLRLMLCPRSHSEEECICHSVRVPPVFCSPEPSSEVGNGEIITSHLPYKEAEARAVCGHQDSNPTWRVWDTTGSGQHLVSGHRPGKEGLKFAVKTLCWAPTPSIASADAPFPLLRGRCLRKLRPREGWVVLLGPWDQVKGWAGTQAGSLQSVPPLSCPWRESHVLWCQRGAEDTTGSPLQNKAQPVRR